jgi:hypothetical protein
MIQPWTPQTKAEAMVVSAATINPEAGTHPVPGDQRALDAALCAGGTCWRRFPYLAERYGERGLRFTMSDSAWLATLAGVSMAEVAGQVFWLRGVLATRGIPSMILQTHLEILSEALDAAIPDGHAAHGKLRLAAVGLRDARLAHISDAQAAALSGAFDSAAPAEWRSRLPDTALLLASAVADETDGCTGAAAALSGWLTDTRRFPAEWAEAVRATAAQAHLYAG